MWGSVGLTLAILRNSVSRFLSLEYFVLSNMSNKALMTADRISHPNSNAAVTMACCVEKNTYKVTSKTTKLGLWERGVATDHNCWDLCPTAAKDHHANGIHNSEKSKSYVAI